MTKSFSKAYLDDDGNIRIGWFIKELGMDIAVPEDYEFLGHSANGSIVKLDWLPKDKHKKRMKKRRRDLNKAGRKDKDGKRPGAKTRAYKLEPDVDDGYKMKRSFQRPYFTSKDKRKYEKYIESIDEFTREEYNWLYIYCLLIWNKEYVGRRKRSKRNRENDKQIN